MDLPEYSLAWGTVFTEFTSSYKHRLLGLTATPVRFLDNNRNIADEFFNRNIVAGVQLSEAIRQRILPTFEYITALYDVPVTKKDRHDLFTEKLYSRANITNIANRMGLSLKNTKPWTSEEDDILKENAFLSTAELMKLLPGRTKAGIAGGKHLLGFASKSMHSWTEDEIEIIRKNPSLTAEALRDRYFPSLTISNINFARKKYDCKKDKNIWEKDRIERFRKLYHAGGYRAVQENEEFSDMSKSEIDGAAHRYNIQSSAARPTTWTEEEKNICMEWLLIPEDQRPPRKTLCQKIPAHSLSGIKDMCRRLSEHD